MLNCQRSILNGQRHMLKNVNAKNDQPKGDDTMKIKHKCEVCTKLSKYYSEISKNYAKDAKVFAEKCQCVKTSTQRR